jgi:hypothetical protein
MSTIPTVICTSEDRRKAVSAAAKINGIDAVEVIPAAVITDPPTLTVYFLEDLSAVTLAPDAFVIAGGERVTGIVVTKVAANAGGDVTARDLTISAEGDLSGYTLVLQQSTTAAIPNFDETFDRQLRRVDFRFHLECATRFDCKRALVCPPQTPIVPSIDYLAKDYATFRQLMLDRMSLLSPAWTERNVADVGVMLVETIAFAADRLSYRQDATATEAYLGTARLRTSVKRHVRLVDYDMHDGCNARVWVHVDVDGDVIGTALAPAIPAHTRLCTTLPGLGSILGGGTKLFQQIEASGAQVFETMSGTIALRTAHNLMPFYAWSATECCLPVGATQGTLAGAFPHLQNGDVLVLAEVKGPSTGDPADADPTRRHAVRLTSVNVTADYLSGAPGIAVTDIAWHLEDALPFPLCVAHSIGSEETFTTFTAVSGAVGNMLLLDHGRTLGDTETLPEALGTVVANRRFRAALGVPYPTFAAPSPFDGTVLAGSATAATTTDPTEALPLSLAIGSKLTVTDARGVTSVQNQAWYAVRSLFDPAVAGQPFAFVPEVENDGTTYLRFGDGVDGAQPDAGWTFAATAYRAGQPSLGNVGATTITHVFKNIPHLTGVWNPLPAAGGVDPESIAYARLRAPYAFNTQERAVTMADYVMFAKHNPAVLAAAAEVRITRSWRTVLITVQLQDGALLDATLLNALQATLDLHRMAGLDVEFENVTLIPLELAMHVCVDPKYRRDEVAQALLARFSDRVLPDGTKGIFHPDNFAMGQPVYVSPFYRAAQAVPGVVSVDVTLFGRSDIPGSTGLTKGYLMPERAEAFTLLNNPDFPERGTFTLTVDGGR